MVYEGFMAVTDRKARAEEKAIAKADLQLKTRLSVMRGWNRGVALDTIALMADLPKKEIVQLIAAFEQAKDYCYATKDIDMEALEKLSGLNESELQMLIKLLKEK